MANECENSEIMDEDDAEMQADNSVWETLTPEQKKYFKKLSEKSPDNMKYIG
ncbi:MAG: hypothetical protein PHC66_02455 [Candidatus Nanoarchaeia archaeon]|nr:hypothetical protein [Candidatus Nanoarchaeia archaeon]MDD5239484.1 hypothetical protein [Candidatus Nanoarchaeia archaeon]